MRGKILERTDLVLLENNIEAVFSHAIIFQTQTPPHPAKTDIKERKKGRLFSFLLSGNSEQVFKFEISAFY